MENDGYAEALRQIDQVRAMVEALRQEPPSPKRDKALTLLEENLARSVLAVRELGL